MNANVRRTQCCIAGGGPAGIMLGYLLARAGVDVIVLEKHADFFRDFRGDTIHPSTLQVMDELGLLDDLLKVKHSQVPKMSAFVGETELELVDFARVPGRSKFIALMPQWDFLNFLAEKARVFPSFHLEVNAQAVDLVREGEAITGVRVDVQGAEQTILADLVIAADGRSSTLREKAGLKVIETGTPIDVLWLRLSREESDPQQTFGTVGAGAIFVMLNRDEYYQCAYVIHKGGIEALRARGLPYFREQIVRLVPLLADRVDEIASWDDVKLLTVAVDHLQSWCLRGLLCIGDAAHAMSPIGGIGINLAIQDAVAAANLLWNPLGTSSLTLNDLQAVERRRTPPTKMTQGMQVFIQNRIITAVLAAQAPIKPPLFLKWLAAIPWFRYIPAYVVGVGFRPEHVHSPAK